MMREAAVRAIKSKEIDAIHKRIVKHAVCPVPV